MPDGWEPVRLGDLIALEYGRALPAEVRSGVGYPVIGSSGETGRHSKTFVQGPSVIIGRKGTVGSVVWCGEPSWPIDTAYWVRPRKQLDLRWLHWKLRTLGLERMDSSTGVPGLNRQEAYDVPIFVPPAGEQRRMVEILDTLDEQIQGSSSSIAKLEELHYASIRESMLLGLECFHEVEASELHLGVRRSVGSWSLVPLGSLLSGIDAGHSPDLEDTPASPGQWGVLKVSAVGNGMFHPEENKVVRDRALFNSAICVHPGDLLMTRANTTQLVGLSCIVENTPPHLMLCDKTLRLRVAHSYGTTKYVHVMLGVDEIRRQIEIEATGTSGSMKNISQQAIRRLMIPLGSPEDVERVVNADALFGAELAVRRSEVEQLQALKQGMMDDLLTGRVRVTDESLERVGTD